jgi:hypothetical protein
MTVVGIDEGEMTFNKGEIFRNGAALHIDHGIAVTSHASQAKTVDQVIVRPSNSALHPTPMPVNNSKKNIDGPTQMFRPRTRMR